MSSRWSSSSRSRRSSSPPCPPSTSARRSSPNTKENREMLNSFLVIAAEAPVISAGKAIALALGIGAGAAGAGAGIGNIFGSMIQSVARQPELRGEPQGLMWPAVAPPARGRAAGAGVGRVRRHRGGRLLRLPRRAPGIRPRLMLVAANPLIQVIPGLMIWTIVSFAITLWVLKRYAFGPVQKLIDDRRDRIRQSIEEADRAREEARSLLEEHRALIGQAKNQAEEILAEARKIADAQRERMRGEVEE